MHRIKHYKNPLACYSQRLVNYIENGIPWDDSEVMQKSMSLEEKGWNVEVRWEKQYIGDKCIGLGVIADEDIQNGSILRTGRCGVNQIIFNPNMNLPNVNDKQTMEYIKNYAFRCPCHVKECLDDLVIFAPGSSSNHDAENPNSILSCWEEGVNVVAIQDISKADRITCDYRDFGGAPDWLNEILSEKLGNSENQMANDYVVVGE